MMMLPLNLGFLPGDVGAGEVLFIFAVVLIFLGPRRLPQVARSIGRAANELRRASRDFQDQVMQLDTEPAPDPPRSPSVSVPDAGGADADFDDLAASDEAGEPCGTMDGHARQAPETSADAGGTGQPAGGGGIRRRRDEGEGAHGMAD
jgi:Sec-independent protein translocase protein TatA